MACSSADRQAPQTGTGGSAGQDDGGAAGSGGTSGGGTGGSSPVSDGSGAIELGAILADNPNAQSCLARKFMGFARGLAVTDEIVDSDGSVQAAWASAGFNLRTLFAAVVSSERFLAPDGANADGGAPDNKPPANEPFTCDVPALLSKHACTGLCHSPSAVSPSAGGGFDMTTPGWEKKLVGAGTPAAAPDTNACRGKGLNYLNKTQPATGLFLDKLKANPPCGLAMPPVGGALSGAEVACLQTWADALVAAAP